MDDIKYEEALAWIHGTLRLGIKPGLKRMELMLKKLDHPEQKNKWIHVAGTNGKGSTVTFIRMILENSGLKVGTFTSPYIEIFNERISVNGKPISDEAIVALVERVRPVANDVAKTEYGAPSEFEIITAMMFLYFAEFETIDYGVIEVGLGGRLDSTNVLTPLISVITTIGLDHTEFLGDTIEAIAGEKGGIIKTGIPVVSGVEQSGAQKILQKISDSKNTSFSQLDQNFFYTRIAPNRMSFHQIGADFSNLEIGLEGDHQLRNAALAIQTVLMLNEDISEYAIRSGLANAFWPGRFEKIVQQPAIILDGAHNPEGVQTLVHTAKQYHRPIHFLTSILGDKDYPEMIKQLQTVPPASITLTTFNYTRAMTEEMLQTTAQKFNVNAEVDWRLWIEKYVVEKHAQDLLIITGSLYFISEVRSYLTSRFE
ncbi:bifunctional folylpolyglutamate synthase/dihydrofolate synthase [Listeria ilorinensis]|uniref:bifunctional folylpolyglutamate synthase/dihydrofolate synthase n=1 Tax=Listeria ilorinensis TaxID=2867439 RepID=UPI001EF4A298|nr:folylpolyglutamate synthase/dihydrofolate synthase family protein [Listeria ilorinensis]